MRWSRRRQESGTEPEQRAQRPRVVPQVNVGDECEAFVNGRYVAWLGERGRAVPAWAWLNLVAHGDAAELAALATGSDESVPPEWRRTLGRLAARATSEAQHAVLVPLELQLIKAGLSPDLSPGQLTLLAEGALDDWAAASRS